MLMRKGNICCIMASNKKYEELEDKCGIYVVTNELSGKRYVGQSKNIKKRWQDHRSKAIHPKKADEFTKELYVDMRTFSLENFSIKILEECSEDELKNKEVEWINKLGTYQREYNHSPGGNLPCEEYKHEGEDHGRALITLDEVLMCRELYKEGKRCSDIYKQYFKEKGIGFSGFSSMWHGKTWSQVKPEVFKNNPYPSQKVTQKDIEDIRRRYDSGERLCSIAKFYKGKLSHTTILGIAHRTTYKDSIHYKSDVSTSSEERSEVIDTPHQTGFS